MFNYVNFRSGFVALAVNTAALLTNCALSQPDTQSPENSLAGSTRANEQDELLVQLGECLATDGKIAISQDDYLNDRPDDYYDLCVSNSPACRPILERSNQFDPDLRYEYEFPMAAPHLPSSVRPSNELRLYGRTAFQEKIDLFNDGVQRDVLWVVNSVGGIKWSGVQYSNDELEDSTNPEDSAEIDESSLLHLNFIRSYYRLLHSSWTRHFAITLVREQDQTFVAVVADPTSFSQETHVIIFDPISTDEVEVACIFHSNYSSR